MSKSSVTFERPYGAVLDARLAEPRRFIQVVTGSRQVGKTTLVQQVAETSPTPVRFASADEPTLRGTEWIAEQWEAVRLAAEPESILVLDEVKKVTGWSETVKRLWDEDSRSGRLVKVVVLGSAPLLIQQGLTESLAGRFEVVHLPHWSYSEMREAFGFSLEQYLYFGGYPGAAPLADDPARWRRGIRRSTGTAQERIRRPLASPSRTSAAGAPPRTGRPGSPSGPAESAVAPSRGRRP